MGAACAGSRRSPRGTRTATGRRSRRHSAMPNEIVAALLQEYADLLEISGGDQFRARNYEKAAKSVAGFSGNVDLLDATTLRQIPGVGASIATKIVEFQQTGAIQALEKLRATVPGGVREMTKIPALGPKRALQLYRELGIGSVARAKTSSGTASSSRAASGNGSGSMSRSRWPNGSSPRSARFLAASDAR